jgi:osmotically-inducible protein OsmY
MANKNRNRNNYDADENWEQTRRRGNDDYQNRSGYGNDYDRGQGGNYGNRSSYGNESNYGQMNNQGFGGNSNRNQDLGESDWKRDNDRNLGQGQSGKNSSGRQDWGRSNVDSGDYDQKRNKGPRNMYGGDTSNYGNANQGSFNRDWWDKTRDEVSSWFGDDDAERRRRTDTTNSGGGHKGKGPKDYKRSEERIKEDAYDHLSDDDMVDATNVQVQVQDNEVILSGTVNDREQKRRAEDIVESISGVTNVQNNIRVSRSGEITDTTERSKSKNW